jgi:hypothetical protein
MASSSVDCEFCNKTFTSKHILLTHQNSAKYCLNIQGRDNCKFECEYCQRAFRVKQTLVDHLTICKEKIKHEHVQQTELDMLKDRLIQQEKDYEDRLTRQQKDYEDRLTRQQKDYEDRLTRQQKDYEDRLTQQKRDYDDRLTQQKRDYDDRLKEERIKWLEARLEEISSHAVTSQPSVTNNTTNHTTNNITVHNYLNLSSEHIKKILSERLNYSVVYGGQEGLAKFVVENILKDKDGKIIYVAVDPSRQMFEFINEQGEKVRDFRSEKLLQTLLKNDVIKMGLDAAAKGWNTADEKLNTKRSTTYGSKVLEYSNLDKDNSVFRTKVIAMTTK